MVVLALAALVLQETRPAPPRDPRVVTVSDALASFEGVVGPVQFVGRIDDTVDHGLVLELGTDRDSSKPLTTLGAASLDTGATIRELWEFSAKAGSWPEASARRRERWDARGEIDGDGVADVLVGEWRWGGEAGDRRGLVVALSVRTGAELHRSSGEAPLDGYGHSVAYLGDVNGDFKDDYALGAPQAKLEEVVFDQNAVSSTTTTESPDGGQVVLRLRNGTRIPLSEYLRRRLDARSEKPGYVSVRSGADGKELRRYVGERRGHGFGTRVVNVGDLDGDGIDDLGVAPSAESNTEIRIFSVAMDEELARLPNLGGPFGTCGDFDGDGKQDLFQSLLDTQQYKHMGAIEIVFGEEWARRLRLESPDRWSPFTAPRSTGDLDGDGRPDFAIGEANFEMLSPRQEREGLEPPDPKRRTLEEMLRIRSEPWVGDMGLESGCVWVYSGATHQVAFGIWAGPNTRAGFGLWVEPTADLDDDGLPDLLVTSQHHVYAFSGNPRRAASGK